MRFPFFICLIIGLIFICSACSDKPYQVLFEQKAKKQDSTFQKSVSNIRNYRIKPQDILQIRNLQNSKTIIDLNPEIGNSIPQGNNTTVPETFQVEDDGTVALTGLGHVHVAGLTRLEAMKSIEELYHKDLQNPIIELKIINLKVTVLGEIKTQGAYPLTKDRTTLVEVIGLAGGLTDKADETNVEIIRGEETNPATIRIDLSNINSITDPKAVLQSGDIIYFAQNKRAVRTDKVQTFSATVQPALLVLSTALLIFTVLRS